MMQNKRDDGAGLTPERCWTLQPHGEAARGGAGAVALHAGASMRAGATSLTRAYAHKMTRRSEADVQYPSSD